MARSARHFPRAAVLAGLALGLAGCGVMGDPVPPSGGSSGLDTASAAATQSVEATVGPTTGIENDFSVSAGDISRNPGASRSGFFLDPLLN